MRVRSRHFRRVDFVLIGVVATLSAFGCVAILAASHGKSVAAIHTTHIVVKQVIWDIVGFIAMLGAASVNYRNLLKWHWWLYGSSVLMLIGVYGFSTVNGAHSWIHLAGFTMEPSEFAKLALVISTAAYMVKVDDQERPRHGLTTLLVIVGLLLVPWGLTFKEPALGQSLVMIATIATMYVVFAKRAHFVIFSSVFVAFVSCTAFMVLKMPVQLTNGIQFLVKHHILKAYQVNRIVSWINPNYDLSNSGFEVHQAQIAVGSGGILGEGLFHGILTNNPGGVPNQTTDYIFTAIAEEFGFVGGVLLILLFLILIQRIIRASALSRDAFGTYILTGIAGMFGFQLFENVGMNMYLSPSTGITLPFISYGGTSVVANYIAIGLALSVALRSKSLSFTTRESNIRQQTTKTSVGL